MKTLSFTESRNTNKNDVGLVYGLYNHSEDLKEWTENKELVGVNPQTFKITLGKEWKKRNIL